MTTKTKKPITVKEGESCPMCYQRSPKYNGWSNYETWAVNLWIGNEQGSYNLWSDTAKELMTTAPFEPSYASQTREDWAKCRMAEMLKDYMEENNPLIEEASMYSDLLSAALGSVNWYEIAEHYIEAAKEA